MTKAVDNGRHRARPSQILYKPVVAPYVAQRACAAGPRARQGARQRARPPMRRRLLRRKPVEFGMPIRNVIAPSARFWVGMTRASAPGSAGRTIKIHFRDRRGRASGVLLGHHADARGTRRLRGQRAVGRHARCVPSPGRRSCRKNIIVGNVRCTRDQRRGVPARVAGERFAVRTAARARWSKASAITGAST